MSHRGGPTDGTDTICRCSGLGSLRSCHTLHGGILHATSPRIQSELLRKFCLGKAAFHQKPFKQNSSQHPLRVTNRFSLATAVCLATTAFHQQQLQQWTLRTPDASDISLLINGSKAAAATTVCSALSLPLPFPLQQHR